MVFYDMINSQEVNFMPRERKKQVHHVEMTECKRAIIQGILPPT